MTRVQLVRWLLPVLIIVAALGSFAALKASKPQAQPNSPTPRTWSVSATEIRPAPLAPELELYAEVENPQQISLRSVLATDVRQVLIREGGRFQQGEELIRLETTEIDLQINQQQAQLAALEAQLSAEQLRHQTDLEAISIEREMIRIAQRALQRQTDLSERSLSSRESLDTADMNYQQRRLNLVSRQQSIADHPNRAAQLQASIAQAQAALEKLQLDRSRAVLTAPFDGRVAALEVAAGDRVKVNDLLARIYPDAELEVRAQLPLRALPLLKTAAGELPPLNASITADGKMFALKLDRLSAEVTPGSAGVDGIFKFSGRGPLPEPGRTLSLKLQLPQINDLIALPPAALYGTNRVYKVEDSQLVAISVEHLGDRLSADGLPEVLIRSTELQAGDRVITTQLPNAISGLKVEVRP